MIGRARLPAPVGVSIRRIVLTFFLLAPSTFAGPLLADDSGAEASERREQTALEALLRPSIDLPRLKRRKDASRSGRVSPEACFYEPDVKGFYYEYMVSPGPQADTEVKRFTGVHLIVYRHGREISDVFDASEKLIAVKSRLSDPDLGDMDLVGVSADEVRARYGAPFSVIGEVLVYYDDHRALSLDISDGKVAWLKYVRLDRAVSGPSRVPACLTAF